MRFPRFIIPLALVAVLAAPHLAAAEGAPPEGWSNSLNATLNFAQNQFKNWEAGGTSSLAWAWGVTGKFERNSPALHWENNLGLEYGLVKQAEEDVRKSVDRLEFETVATRKLAYYVEPYASASFKTQFTAGRDYDAAQSVIDAEGDFPKTSSFADPLYLAQAFGVGRKFDPYLRSRVGFAVQETITDEFRRYSCTSDDREQIAADLGLDPGNLTDEERQQLNEALDEACDDVKVETGLESVTTYDRAFTEDTVFNSRLRLFYSFEQSDQLDYNWRNDLTTKVFKYIAFSFGFELLYDKDVRDDVQIKQILGLGLSFSLI